MSDLLLEIGVEALPASWVLPAADQLLRETTERFRRENIRFGAARRYATPRRLAVYLSDVFPRQPDNVQEIRGPSARAAFDAEGNYTSIAYGFARSQDVFPEDLKLRRVAGGEFLFVDHVRPGQPTRVVAARLFPEILGTLAFPKRLRAGEDGQHRGRPIRWLLALFGDQVIPFSLGDLESGRVTYGHPLLSPEPLPLPDATAYLPLLAEVCVLPDPEARRAVLTAQLSALSRQEGAVLPESDLLEEQVFRVEYPTVFAGGFAPEFLRLPREVLELILREQHCFLLASTAGELLPRFLDVHDGGSEGLEEIRQAQERALHARLTDARYFLEEDLRVPLPQRVPELSRFPFLEHLGTLYEKAQRLQILASFLCDTWRCDDPARAVAGRAALLSKADQTTAMVRELPALRGILGRVYARCAGEPEVVAVALAEYYQPRFPGDALPASRVGQLLAVADRVDTLVGSFAAGQTPYGAQDPYALREQAEGLMAILLEALPLSLSTLIARSYSLYGERGSGWRSLTVTQASLLDFLRVCLEKVFNARGIHSDTADAVLAAGFDNPRAALARALALDAVRDTPAFAVLASAAVRTSNLIRFAAGGALDAPPGEVRLDLLEDEAEQALYGEYLDVFPQVEQTAQEEDYPGVLRLLGTLSPFLEQFFDNVLVMSDDETLRINRLRLVMEIQALFLTVADFSRLEGADLAE